MDFNELNYVNWRCKVHFMKVYRSHDDCMKEHGITLRFVKSQRRKTWIVYLNCPIPHLLAARTSHCRWRKFWNVLRMRTADILVSNTCSSTRSNNATGFVRDSRHLVWCDWTMTRRDCCWLVSPELLGMYFSIMLFPLGNPILRE